MKLLCALIAAAAIVLFDAGCATFSATPSVTSSVVSVHPTRASLFELGAVVTLRMINGSPEPLALAGSTHRLYLNGRYVGRGVSDAPLAVPRLATTTLQFTLFLESLALVREFAELQQTPTADYRLESEFYSADGAPRRVVRTLATGELDLTGLRRISAGLVPAK